MSVTAQEIFSAAMGLIDSVDQASGQTDIAANASYKARTLFIINVLRGELYPFSDSYIASEDGTRPICAAVTDFTSALGLDEVVARTVLPYGLAAQLLLEENPSTASFYQQRYEELTARLGSGIPRSFESIEDVYGAVEFSSGGEG